MCDTSYKYWGFCEAKRQLSSLQNRFTVIREFSGVIPIGGARLGGVQGPLGHPLVQDVNHSNDVSNDTHDTFQVS